MNFLLLLMDFLKKYFYNHTSISLCYALKKSIQIPPSLSCRILLSCSAFPWILSDHKTCALCSMVFLLVTQSLSLRMSWSFYCILFFFLSLKLTSLPFLFFPLPSFVRLAIASKTSCMLNKHATKHKGTSLVGHPGLSASREPALSLHRPVAIQPGTHGTSPSSLYAQLPCTLFMLLPYERARLLSDRLVINRTWDMTDIKGSSLVLSFPWVESSFAQWTFLSLSRASHLFLMTYRTSP